MKLVTVPSSIDEIRRSLKYASGFIIGIKDYSVNTNLNINIDEVSNIKSVIGDKELFISLNKNLENKDLPAVEDIMEKLDNMNISGVLFYDVAVISIYNKNKFKYSLILNQEHLSTNYNTINYYRNFSVNCVYLSNDITKAEIVDIKNNSSVKLFVCLFGHLPMFVSKRHIVKNYLNYFNLKDNSNINFIEKEGSIYPIIDSDIGTCVYSNNIINGLDYIFDINADYVVLNSFNINIDDFIEVLKLFSGVDLKNVHNYSKKIDSMFKNIDRGFLDRETIYRVKKNEK